MTTATSLTVRNERANEEDMFSDLEPISAFAVKKIDLATQLNALMVSSGTNRSDMAEALGWKKSQVTRVLSGKNNFTVKTIWDFSSGLGFDFDIVFRAPNQQRPKQPWQLHKKEETTLPVEGLRTLHLPIVMQSAGEVAVDFLAGRAKGNYFSFDTRPFENVEILGFAAQELPSATLTSLVQNETHVHVKVTQKLRK